VITAHCILPLQFATLFLRRYASPIRNNVQYELALVCAGVTNWQAPQYRQPESTRDVTQTHKQATSVKKMQQNAVSVFFTRQIRWCWFNSYVSALYQCGIAAEMHAASIFRTTLSNLTRRKGPTLSDPSWKPKISKDRSGQPYLYEEALSHHSCCWNRQKITARLSLH
jgi:hypothetical protein